MTESSLMDTEILFLQVSLPGRPMSLAGFLIHDLSSGTLEVRLARSWELIADESDAEVLSGYREIIECRCRDLGATRAIAEFEDTLSNVVRLSNRMRLCKAMPSEMAGWADVLAGLLLP